MHLRRHRGVSAVVRSEGVRLVQGRVEAVQLSGLDWHSRAGLTARRLTVSAPDGAALSYLEVLAGRIALTAPAYGWAEAVFSAADFGNFLLYRPVTDTVPAILGERFVFSGEGVSIDVARKKGGVWRSPGAPQGAGGLGSRAAPGRCRDRPRHRPGPLRRHSGRRC
ncbi:unnamed protein product [Prorocentrum cordatum]|uniref:Altered inheritance of mitochondria protein 24, mitochondrial n=1 Tax=Prorocentrum cordatum TaxID=2364126 RepID=A0ABN9W3P2_9DINO|nr:unnamed protein product [Polarella glacialis]